MAVWFTSDTHFGDPRVLRIDKRPFAGLDEHDEALVAAWTARVAADDEVWHLGDFCLARPAGRAGALLGRLSGTKHLIVGNNDGPATLQASGWASVRTYAEIEVDGHRLVLCHYPFRTWNNMGKGWIDLHGHSHGRLKPITRQIDVGVDAWAFAPVSLAAMLAARRIGPARHA
jgi:calcineurin-like phosphoesterase family protein